MSFKEWLRSDLDNAVQKTVSFVKDENTKEYANQTGVNPNNNYVPNLSNNTILGINKWVVYSVIGLAVIGVGIAIRNNIKNAETNSANQ